MLDGLLGRGFSSKCKSLIKATRTRIDVLRRRLEATQRFLKGNLAQLLSNGLDINAFGRTAEFLSGLNLLACYDFLEHSCEYTLKKLSMMQKQSDCPEECREAVGSLMFAAARFSDLPELRDLRDALQERYGSSLEHFVNREFVERLAMKPPSIDKKIQLLQDIASELSIKWDSRGFQQRMMANPSAPAPAPAPAQNQEKKQEHIHDCDTKNNLRIDNETAVKSNKPDQLLKVKSELTSDRIKAKNGGENYLMTKHDLGHRSFGGIESTASSGTKHMGSEQNTIKRYKHDTTPRARREKSELSGDDLRGKNGSENYLMRKDELGPLSFGRGESTGNSGKPRTGSEHNIYRRDHYDVTPVGGQQDGEFSSYRLGAKNDKDNYFMRTDESNVLLFEQGDSRGNSCKPHIELEKNSHRRENYGIIPMGRPEEGEFNSDGLREIHGRANYLARKDELAHLAYGPGDPMGSSLKTHFNSDKTTVRKEIYNTSPHHGRELTGDKNEPSRINGKEDTVQKRDRHGNSSREKRPDGIDEQNTSQRGIYDTTPRHRRELVDNKNEPTRVNGNGNSVHRRERHGKMPEVTGAIFEAQNNKTYGFPKSYNYDFIAEDRELPSTRDGKTVSSADYRDYKEPIAAKSPKIIQEEEKYRLNPNSSYALPPPYVKSKDKFVPPPYMKTVEGKKAISDRAGAFVDPTIHKIDEDLSNYGHEKDVPYRDNIPLPKPRSIRRKHSKSLSHRDDLGDSEDSEVVKRSSSSRRRDHHHSKKGLQILFDEEHKQTDDEERKIDKLLIHYSKKPSTYDDEKVRRKVKSHSRESPRNEGEASDFPTRSVSLPRENITSEEHVKIYARANSFQPDKPAGHVHPKLPDYDDLAARFAALKGR